MTPLTESSKPEMPMPDAAAVPAKPMKWPELVMLLMFKIMMINGDTLSPLLTNMIIMIMIMIMCQSVRARTPTCWGGWASTRPGPWLTGRTAPGSVERRPPVSSGSGAPPGSVLYSYWSSSNEV